MKFCGPTSIELLLIVTVLAGSPLLPAQQSHLDRLNAQVQQLYREGKYAEATPIAEEEARAAETAYGSEDPRFAKVLNDLAVLLVAQGQFSQAEPFHKRALAIREKALGPDHPDVASSLANLGMLYVAEAQYSEAEPLYKRALQIDEKALGPDHPDVATLLGHLAELYDDEGQYADAEPLDQRALQIDEKALVPEDAGIAADLNNLAGIYDDEGKLALEEPLLKRALAIDEKVYGGTHPIVAKALNNLAELYQRRGRYSDAEGLLLRSLAIRQKDFGPDNPETAIALSNLGQLYSEGGKFADAEPLLRHALNIDQNAFGPNHPQVAIDLDNLASFLQNQGKYALAEPLFIRCIAIREKVLGPEHPDVATAVSNLGTLYEGQGKYSEAEARFIRALQIDKKSPDADPTRLARDANNLAVLYMDEGRYADAEPALKTVAEIDEKVLGPNAAELAATLGNLGTVYEDEKRYSEAEPRYQRALQIDEANRGPEDPGLAGDLNNLALLYDDEGKYAAAEPLYLRALSLQKKALGPDHPQTANTLVNLAELYDSMGRFADAAPLFQQAMDNLLHQFQYSFTYMTEKERLGFLSTIENYFPIYSSFAYRSWQKNPEIAGAMYNLLLWEKGFIASSVTRMRRQAQASGDAETLKLLATLSTKRTQIATLLNAEPPDRDLWRLQLNQLRSEADEVEKSLVARSSAFAEQTKVNHATWQQIRDALGPGEAAIEFTRFRYFDKELTSTSYYVALIITHDTEDHPAYIVLGDAKRIENAATASYHVTVQTRGMEAEDVAALPTDQDYDLIWKPLEKSLAGITRIYLSPDGALNQIPVGIIAGADGKMLMEQYDLRLVASTRELLRTAAQSTDKTALLVGDPNFDLSRTQQNTTPKKPNGAQPETPTAEDALPGDRSRDLAGVPKLPRLPGTAAEVKAIADLMAKSGWRASTYTQDLALKRTVEDAASPRVVHLATHGFFLADQAATPSQRIETPNHSNGLEDPMLRSGVYFAGANRTLAGSGTAEDLDNGVLTAMEASNLNLSNTELVVLSACDTGKGDFQNGEGVFGLPRALHEAGARAVLMSLWSIPDQETLELMQRFYSKWLSGTEKHEALRQAQLEMRQKVKQDHNGRDLPYYWAAFVLVGR